MSENREDNHNHRCSTIPGANVTVSVNSEDDRLQSNNNNTHVKTVRGRPAAWRRRNEEPSRRWSSGDDLQKSNDSQETTTGMTTCRRCCLQAAPSLPTSAAAEDVVTSAIRIAVPPTALLYLFIALLYCCCCCGFGCSAATVLRRNEPYQRQQELINVEPQDAYVQAPSSPPFKYMALRRNSLLLAAPALLISSQQQQEQQQQQQHQQQRQTAFMSKSGSNALNALRIPPPPPSLSVREDHLDEDSTPNRPFFFVLTAPSAIVPTRTLFDCLKANAKALSDRDDKSESFSAVVRKVEKRRLVVRVPFAQNPDNMQLSRIYKSLFTQQKQKKRPSMDGTYRYISDDNNNKNNNNNIDDGKPLHRKE